MIKSIIKLARIDHWIKNVVVLMPVIFAQKMTDTTSWILAFAAAAAFCFAISIPISKVMLTGIAPLSLAGWI